MTKLDIENKRYCLEKEMMQSAIILIILMW